MYPFNISGVDAGKESEQVKGGVDITVVITYKNPFVVNGKLVTVSIALGQEMAYNTIFAWPLLKTINSSIITEKIP